MDLKVLSGFKNTQPFLESIREEADAHRESFGFTADSVYEELARKDALKVLVDITDSGSRYLGHLFFYKKFPTVKILQMFTKAEYRKTGLATILLNDLKQESTREGFTSISARVAQDLVEANNFWERKKFYIQSIKDGGKTRKRKILVRCCELDSPQLFPRSSIDANNPLGLNSQVLTTPPIFLLDLNVVFDLTGPRRARHEVTKCLVHLERMGACRLSISEEIKEELSRTANDPKPDPISVFVAQFPFFPKPPTSESKLLEELASIVFPQKLLSKNDKSDLIHIATVIHHGLTGLVTSDGRLISVAEKIKEKFKVEVVSPEVFLADNGETEHRSEFEYIQGEPLSLREVRTDEEGDLRQFLLDTGLTASDLISGWLPNKDVAKRVVVWEEKEIVGYATWAVLGEKNHTQAKISVDPKNNGSIRAGRILLTYLLEQVSRNGVNHIDLYFPDRQSDIRDLAHLFGFRGIAPANCLTKIVFGSVLTKSNWKEKCQSLNQRHRITLPEDISQITHLEQPIPVTTQSGDRVFVAVDSLETLLGPSLICFPGRAAVITPIQKKFSEQLLGGTPQLSLLPQSQATIFQDRHYLSDPRTLKHFKKGTVILFYESGKGKGKGKGQEAIIAIARVQDAYLKKVAELNEQDLERSVLTDVDMTLLGKAKEKTITVFDNIFALPRPVPLTELRRLKCGEAHQLITTKTIDNSQLQSILQWGFGG